jgi:hypothetical protein
LLFGVGEAGPFGAEAEEDFVVSEFEDGELVAVEAVGGCVGAEQGSPGDPEFGVEAGVQWLTSVAIRFLELPDAISAAMEPERIATGKPSTPPNPASHDSPCIEWSGDSEDKTQIATTTNSATIMTLIPINAVFSFLMERAMDHANAATSIKKSRAMAIPKTFLSLKLT